MPRSSRPLRIFPIVMRRVRVAGIDDLTPNMRRLTLTGDELAEGVMGDGYRRPAFRSDGFDDHVKLVVPPAEGELPRVGTQEETRFAWNPEVLGNTRDYTVRSWDPEKNTFAIDVARHDAGLAASWAFNAQVGDAIQFAGPKSCALVNTDADWHLLAGDETALPAIARWLEEAPETARGHVVIEIPTAEDRQRLHTRAGVTIEWLVRAEAPAGATTQLFDAVRRIEVPEGRVYAWTAGEAMAIAPIRRYLRGELGLPKEDVEVVGYWRRPKAVTAAKETARDNAESLVPAPAEESTETSDLPTRIHEMTELAPPVLTRAAVTLGINPAVSSGVTTVEGLAAETGVPAGRLAPLLDGMTALGLLERERDHFGNTPLGAVLCDDSVQDELCLDNPANRETLALVDLVDVLRADGHAERLGELCWRERRVADPDLDAAHQDRAAEQLAYVLDLLPDVPAVRDATTLAVSGDAAPHVAGRIARGRTVHLPGTDVAAWPDHDCAILVAALEGRTDEECRTLLRTALAAGRALVLFERTSDKAAVDDHAAEHALTSLAVTGAPLRSSGQVAALLRAAGAATVERTVLGWGFGPFGTVTVAHA
ncbi:siderophore-interacting protein [Streptomyces reniochalinae]|uniref:Siderophore-interacting protein n=1 Tax=Streptomyces reniochalinae TaxID=2250578 RepID=A0A367EQE7_9ACTN|nr:siderophore-interacting protein [Streptomyces reniochalinae]RCG20314.1 siderophore-interacting protein [Streptomyces reniochalinae]